MSTQKNLIILATTAAALLAVTTLLVLARLPPPRKLRSQRVQRHFKPVPAATNDALSPVLAAVINNLFSSYPDTARRSFLPPFKEQLDLLISEYRGAKSPGVPLLVVGPPGIGKTTTLINWLHDEIKSRPAIYIDLGHELGSRAVSSFSDGQTWFRRCIERALGFTDEVHQLAIATSPYRFSRPEPPNNVASSSTTTRTTRFSFFSSSSHSAGSPNVIQAFRHIVQALRTIRARNRGRPSLLVIDEAQLLLTEGALDGDDTEQTMEFLGVCEEEGLLEVVMCGTEDPVETMLQKVPGFGKHLATFGKHPATLKVTPASTSDLIRYLLRDVNPHRLPPLRRFTATTAQRFADAIGGNLTELERFCGGQELTVEEFITERGATGGGPGAMQTDLGP
ncbi:hypothetical protein BC937DRAFT_90938 [Endogone sp. FLAS-F59071]|nr:hypothetical protein BC937DRAFT_90938 [Endogone sp. FLAS-F59071]|eukprot:RUS16672.1 hypothetical protein BC937DRAFT_90938 [Endogone sp. FLAS-F59071]